MLDYETLEIALTHQISHPDLTNYALASVFVQDENGIKHRVASKKIVIVPTKK